MSIKLVIASIALAVMTVADASDDANSREVVVDFACRSGATLQVRFRGDSATVQMADKRTLSLKQQPTGDGYRYADARFAVRGVGRNLTLTGPGGLVEECSESASKR